MTEAERFREVDRLFKQVCDLEPGAREQRLIELAPGDERLRSEVIELLEAEARADASRGLTPEALQAEISAALGGVEDPVELAGYRVLSRLGAGGMGVVYEAEQRSPRRTVALKVLRPGLATPDLVRRFEFEAEALGRLRHPGIAQVYEAGVAETDAGPRPFFAMELVRGAPLDRWARETGASPRQRLEMMARVCDAVQHAHAQGVIHRDLKPANILVTPEGETPQSAVVILHGSGGLFSTPDRDDTKLEVDHHFSDWTDLLARQGHAVLLPSSFYSRGYFEWDDAPRSVDEVDRLIMRTHDAYGALHYMCDQPFVDCDRVGLLGFSNGASTTMMSVFDGVDDVAGMHSLEDPAVRARFTVAYAYYPGCGQQGLIEGMRYFPMAPLSIFHGSEDPIVEHCTARLDEAID